MAVALARERSPIPGETLTKPYGREQARHTYRVSQPMADAARPPNSASHGASRYRVRCRIGSRLLVCAIHAVRILSHHTRLGGDRRVAMLSPRHPHIRWTRRQHEKYAADGTDQPLPTPPSSVHTCPSPGAVPMPSTYDQTWCRFPASWVTVAHWFDEILHHETLHHETWRMPRTWRDRKRGTTAWSPLPLQQGGLAGGQFGMTAQSTRRVDPVSVVGACIALDLDMALDGNAGVRRQRYSRSRSEHPMPVPARVPVVVPDPRVGFLRVSPFSPVLQLPVEDMIHLPEHLLGDLLRVVVGPADNLPIEVLDQRRYRTLSVAS